MQTLAQRLDHLPVAARTLFDYWRTLPTRDLVPSRRDFDPARLPRLLPDLIMLEDVGPDHFSVRLAGGAYTDAFGHDPTGNNVLDYCLGETRAIIRRSVRLVMRHPCALYSTRIAEHDNGRTSRRSGLLLPLRNNDGAPTLVISVNLERDSGIELSPLGEYRIVGYEAQEFLDIGAGVPPAERQLRVTAEGRTPIV